MAWKAGIRVIGFDDAPHAPGDAAVPVVGVTTRGRQHVEAVLRLDVAHDGDEATEAIAAAVARYAGRRNLVAVLLQNLMVAGFNVVDLPALAEATGLPAVATMKGRPDRDAIHRALHGSVDDGARKWARYDAAGPGFPIPGGWAWCAGLPDSGARGLLACVTADGTLPEAVRLAHLIAAGWVLGESRGS